MLFDVFIAYKLITRNEMVPVTLMEKFSPPNNSDKEHLSHNINIRLINSLIISSLCLSRDQMSSHKSNGGTCISNGLFHFCFFINRTTVELKLYFGIFENETKYS